MIKIIMNGCCGKMGKVISTIVNDYPNLTISAGIDKIQPKYDTNYPVYNSINDCTVSSDVVLDFSRPDSLDDLLNFCKKNNLPLVLCTTGYNEDQIAKIEDFSKSIPVFRSANMSIGINVINNILKQVSTLLYNDFDIEIIEKHHNQKVDSPSGTALLLANTIKSSLKEDTSFVYGRKGNKKREHDDIGIHAIRGGNIIGEHEIIFAGHGETITLKHHAISRDVFAIGALKACEFMYNKEKGLYSMDDIIQSQINI